jgi:uncharacterized tellurite resistance protein B-like protein
MLNAIKNFFEQNLYADDSVQLDQQLRLATAALMIEMMNQDDRVEETELDTIKRSLQSRFGLSDQETDELFDLAWQEARNSTDYYQFTSLINRHYSQEQKVQVVEYLWSIAYADGELDTYEEHMVRRIAELLYVSHKDFIQSKHRVLDALLGPGLG